MAATKYFVELRGPDGEPFVCLELGRPFDLPVGALMDLDAGVGFGGEAGPYRIVSLEHSEGHLDADTPFNAVAVRLEGPVEHPGGSGP